MLIGFYLYGLLCVCFNETYNLHFLEMHFNKWNLFTIKINRYPSRFSWWERKLVHVWTTGTPQLCFRLRQSVAVWLDCGPKLKTWPCLRVCSSRCSAQAVSNLIYFSSQYSTGIFSFLKSGIGGNDQALVEMIHSLTHSLSESLQEEPSNFDGLALSDALSHNCIESSGPTVSTGTPLIKTRVCEALL